MSIIFNLLCTIMVQTLSNSNLGTVTSFTNVHKRWQKKTVQLNSIVADHLFRPEPGLIYCVACFDARVDFSYRVFFFTGTPLKS